MKTGRLVPMLVVMGVLAVACGRGGAADTRQTTVPATATSRSEPATTAAGAETRSSAEDAFAESLLLTAADFPPGWVHEPHDPGYDPQSALDVPDPLRRCVLGSFDGQTGRAYGGEYSDNNTTILSINPLVYVFDSAEHAQAAAQAIIAQQQCLGDVVGDGLDVGGTWALGKTYTEPLDASAFGGTAAIRSYQTQVYKTEQPPHSDVLVFDVVIVVEGRVLSEVDGFRRFSPIDQRLLKRYVDLARTKIRQEP